MEDARAKKVGSGDTLGSAPGAVVGDLRNYELAPCSDGGNEDDD